MAGGRKEFTNSTGLTLSVTIYIRAGADPDRSAGEQTFGLNPWQSKTIEYGNATNIYLNGMEIVSMHNGEVVGQQRFVARRGSPIDNLLNMNSYVVIQQEGDGFNISSHN